jgi:hypothetical protein
MELLQNEMLLTQKGKRVGADGKQHENRNYTIRRRSFRCWDKANPISRQGGAKEADAIPGTLSHYCFGAWSGSGVMQLRQYSCYCKPCSKREWRQCGYRAVVRSEKHKPKSSTVDSLMRWHNEGWVVYRIALKEDTELRQLREVSSERRLAFVNALGVGDVVGVYCAGGGAGGEVDHTFFWLAKLQEKSRADARIGDSPVLMRADATDPSWDIARGEYILNIQ